MVEISSVMASIIANAASKQTISGKDYINPDDGLLYCGNCNTPKQFLLNLPAIGDEEPRLEKVPIMCKCKEQEYEEEKRREQERKDLEYIELLRSRSFMGNKFVDNTFDSFRVTKGNEAVLKICHRYADNFGEMIRRNQGLLFYGNVGTGKTFAAACIANALLNRKVSVVMTSFVELLRELQGFKENEQELTQKLCKAKLLIVDDLGAERNSEFALEKVYEVIDARYRSKLPMVLTTNLSLEEMKQATDIRRSRIYDRIFEMCYPVCFTGPSFRKAEASKRYKETKYILEGE